MPMNRANPRLAAFIQYSIGTVPAHTISHGRNKATIDLQAGKYRQRSQARVIRIHAMESACIARESLYAILTSMNLTCLRGSMHEAAMKMLLNQARCDCTGSCTEGYGVPALSPG